MKTFGLYIIFIVCFVSMACEENIDPKAEFKTTYSVSCIVRCDTNYQVATVQSSYDVAGYNPLQNTRDRSIVGADIRIWSNPNTFDDVFIFRDSLVSRNNSERYNTHVSFYYVDSLKPASETELELEVILPFGKRLKSTTKTPAPVEISHDYWIPSPLPSKRDISISWSYSYEGQRVVHPIMTLHYAEKIDGIEVPKSKVIPRRYLEENNELIPLYTKPSYDRSVNFDLDAITKAIMDIGLGESNKKKFRMKYVVVSVMVFDKNLSSYYASSNDFFDDYTIRIDDIDFTNIEGGKGVFASYFVQNITIPFEINYITDMGFLPE